MNQNQATISASDWDMGSVNFCFDSDTNSIMSSSNINPAFVQIEFNVPTEIIKARVFLEYQNDWWLEAADTQEDLDNKGYTYRSTPKRTNLHRVWDEYLLGSKLRRKIWKFNVERTVGDNYVHIAELELWNWTAIDTLTINPISLATIPFETNKLTCFGRDAFHLNKIDIGSYVTWHADNPDIISLTNNGYFFGRKSGFANIWAEYHSLISAAVPITVMRENVALLIDNSIYLNLEQEFNTFKTDVEQLFPVNLVIYSDTNFNSMTPPQIRTYIQDLYFNQNIKGIILAGLIPYALWQNREPENRGINSFYYEDLDGIFIDTDSDGYDDYHPWNGNFGPEVWVCWMRPPANNQIEGLRSFLNKTHDYYNGEIFFNHKAFAVAHSDYDVTLFDEVMGTVNRLEEIYGQLNVDVDGEGIDLVFASDYLAALQNNRYEILDVTSHASTYGQNLDGSEVVVSEQIRDLTGGSIMSFIYGCHSAAFNENPNANTALMYVMGNSIGQVASGTSWSYGNGEKRFIYDVLKAGDYVGHGWMNMISKKYNVGYIVHSYGTSVDTSRHLWGDNLLGNPFVFAKFDSFLPVELTSFAANLNKKDVILRWQTATEMNSYGFEIERSLTQTLSEGEGINKWMKIGFVQGSGNSSSPNDYSFEDKNVKGGKYNYRLKMIDNDGTFEYSNIVEVEILLPKEYAISQNYPNPFNPTTRIDYQLPFDSKVTIELYGITGEKIATLINNDLSAGYYTLDVNANTHNLASGVYICRMIAQDQSKQTAKTFIQIKKLMLLK